MIEHKDKDDLNDNNNLSVQGLKTIFQIKINYSGCATSKL